MSASRTGLERAGEGVKAAGTRWLRWKLLGVESLVLSFAAYIERFPAAHAS